MNEQRIKVSWCFSLSLANSDSRFVTKTLWTKSILFLWLARFRKSWCRNRALFSFHLLIALRFPPMQNESDSKSLFWGGERRGQDWFLSVWFEFHFESVRKMDKLALSMRSFHFIIWNCISFTDRTISAVQLRVILWVPTKAHFWVIILRN